MKKLSIILCALCLIGMALWAQARTVTVVTGGVAAAAGGTYPGFTYDVYEDFEDALGGAWTESDASSIINAQDSSAEYRGTYGMSVSSGSAAEAWVSYTFPAAKDGFSVGFWMKTGAYAAYAGDRWFFIAYNEGEGNLVILREGNSAGDDSRRISWSIDSDVVSISDDTWYWVTFKFVRNGTSQVSIYNTSGAQVGSTMSGSTIDFATDYIVIGAYSTASATACYYDEVFIDYTDSTFPLGPPSGS